MKDQIEIRTHYAARPFRSTAKSLLVTHLVPVMGPHPHQGKTYDVFGIPVVCQRSPLKVIEEIEDSPHLYTSVVVESIRTAKALADKARRLEHLLAEHPDPGRIPALSDRTEVPPMPEDEEVNSLVLEARTLKHMHTDNYVFLWGGG